MKSQKNLLTALLLAAIAIAPVAAAASWVMEPEDQHATLAKCPRGFRLVSVEAGDADLLVCAPKSRRTKRTQPDQARLPKDAESPQESPKLN
jgi:hypothetical protein